MADNVSVVDRMSSIDAMHCVLIQARWHGMSINELTEFLDDAPHIKTVGQLSVALEAHFVLKRVTG